VNASTLLEIFPEPLTRKVFLTPGTLWCGADPAIVTTVLGSCIAVCLIDLKRRRAGMNHYVMPFNPAGENSLRYGDIALNRLMVRMIEIGSKPQDLRAKLFGGANVLPFGVNADTVGAKNTKVAVEWLRSHNIPISARRTGGNNGLFIRMNSETGKVLVRNVLSSADLDNPEAAYDSRLIPALGREG